MMYSGLCHLAVCIEADITMVVSTLVGHINMFTTVSLIVMLIVGTVFSIWMAKHDNLEVS